jgi:hypothetical protein
MPQSVSLKKQEHILIHCKPRLQLCHLAFMQQKFTLVLFVFSMCLLQLSGQEGVFSYVSGIINDADNKEAVDFATIILEGSQRLVQSGREGQFRLAVPAEQSFVLIISRVGYKEARIDVQAIPPGATRFFEIELAPSISGLEVTITDSRLENPGMIRQDVEALRYLPTTSGNLESVLPHIALGLSSGTGGELSSQYNVRGGNYDENLIYVNDFEIYRPQLIRSGQQEGLTFANMDLVRDLSFSSGGFQAKYGDKQSSVLDVRYKLPTEFKGSISGSFLGASAHIEGSRAIRGDSYRKFRYLVGARYKTTRYLLGSLDIVGEYIPDFTDVQAYLTYDLSREWQLAYLGNFNNSLFRFKPQSGLSATGLINFALNLRTNFEGQERDLFRTNFHGVSLTWLPDRVSNPMYMKFLASTYQANENEGIDIIGAYSLFEIDTNLGSENAGEPVAVLGSGVQHLFARNFLKTNVTNIEWKGGVELKPESESSANTHFLQWGLRLQYEQINDRLNEWERLDSALYSLDFSEEFVNMKRVYKSRNFLESGRLSAFVQDIFTRRIEDVGEFQLSYGLRAQYWTLNKEWTVTPRAQVSYRPLNTEKDIIYRLAAGLYHQPPFYRELRRVNGTVNEDVLAQKSAHILAGITYDFTAGSQVEVKYRLIAEVYYKHLWDLVSYDVDNVRIRYSGENDATGYVTGIDVRLNGEFVPGVESWVNLSFLRARERLDGIQHLKRNIGDVEAREVSDVPRPTDQLMLMSVFFQDHLPRNENLKVHMNFTFGTGLPFGLPENNTIYRNTYRFRPYRRVDIGFSFLLWDKVRISKYPRHFLRFSDKTWISVEVFNLLQMANVANNTWVKSIYNIQYAIPNNLTSRRINLRFRIEF